MKILLGNLSEKSIDFLKIDFLVEKDAGNYILDSSICMLDPIQLPLEPFKERECLVTITGKLGMKKGKFVFQYGNNDAMSSLYSRSIEFFIDFTIVSGLEVVRMDLINMRKLSLLPEVSFSKNVLDKIKQQSQIDWFLLMIDISNNSNVDFNVNFDIKVMLQQDLLTLGNSSANVKQKELKRILLAFANDPAYTIIQKSVSSAKTDNVFAKDQSYFIDFQKIIDITWVAQNSKGILTLPRFSLPKHLNYAVNEKIQLEAGLTTDMLSSFTCQFNQPVSFRVKIKSSVTQKFIMRIIPKINSSADKNIDNLVIKGFLQVYSCQILDNSHEVVMIPTAKMILELKIEVTYLESSESFWLPEKYVLIAQ